MHSLASPKEGEAFYKAQLDVVSREKKQLQERLETLERDYRDLRRSFYELSLGAGEGYADFDAALSGSLVAPAAGGHDGDSSSDGGANSTRFANKIDLVGHTGAVYSVQFSPSGRLLASGSFDRSVRVWNVERPSDGAVSTMLNAHESNIVDVVWSSDSTLVFSGGYDRKVKEWDVLAERDSPLASYDAVGLVQAVAVSQVSDDMLYIASSHPSISCYDRRAPHNDEKSAAMFTNDCMVNSLCLSTSGVLLTSGDRRGAIKVWDVRKSGTEPLSVQHNEVDHRPITHVHTNQPLSGDDEGHLLAVNSYDNYLRVYERGERLLGAVPESLKALHVLRGHRNRNWPIKSSFFTGRHYRPAPALLGQKRVEAARMYADDEELGLELAVQERHESRGLSAALLLATASADGKIYIFDVGAPAGKAQNVQVLSGHQDRCYAVNFHHSEPLLASCSADFLIKLWTPIKANNQRS